MVAAAVAAAALSCHPEPGVGTLTYTRRGRHALDLATCRDRILRPGASKPRPFVSPDGRFVAGVVAKRQGDKGTNAIVVRNRSTGARRTVYLVHESYRRIPAGAPGPIVLYRWSGDSRWLFFAIDPQGSNSIAADGLLLQVVSTRGGGPPHRLGMTLGYADYLTWCSGRLVFTGGGNRLATTNKQLLVASPTAWRARPLIRTPKRAWGSAACAPDGRSVVTQSQPTSEDYNFSATRWELWRIGMNGSQRRLTSPPPLSADDSPRYSRDGRSIFFVRSRRGVGSLFALRGERLSGPLLQVGYNLGYYGHRDWWLRR